MKKYGWPGLVKYMEYFWYRVACPLPDGWWQCHLAWLSGGPYNWTKRLCLPWQQIQKSYHTHERPFAWVRLILSFLLIPWGLVIWKLNDCHWPLLPKRTNEGGYKLGMVL